MTLDEQVQLIEETMDRILHRLVDRANQTVVLFSGGIDSGFIASRLARLGQIDTLLANFSFGPHDPESHLAEAMARELGLRFLRIESEEGFTRCLDDPGKVYPQPFGDHSTVPTSALGRALVNGLDGSALLLDGTGADGGFGLSSKISQLLRIYSIPKTARKLLSVPYISGVWLNASTFETMSRVMRRTVQMPATSALVAQNPLGNVVYDGEFLPSLYSALDRWLMRWAGHEQRRLMVAADLALTGANVFAQKALAIVEDAGHAHQFPFLDFEMVSLALQGAASQTSAVPKAALKRSLERWLPTDMIYRQKSGFVDPNATVFYDPLFLEHLAATDQGVLENLVNRRRVLQLLDRLHSRRPLPAQTLNLTWAIVFTDRWYKTVSPVSDTALDDGR